ncbi:MAG: F0F1 ATP synthase subunit gamma, partial [Deltaproteobacteria bacterium]|nr:F0F1 ATP synthase subunit gamma [Deltaproteobacteria bacterium]
GKAPVIAAVGARVKARIEDAGRSVRTDFSLPDSTFNIVSKVQDILALIEDWTTKKRMNLIFLYHSKQVSGARYEQHSVRLLPVDQEWLGNMQKRPWPNHCIPLFTMDWNVLFSALIRQYLFISVFRAFAESMASENASRLAAMQGAEKNIQDRLEELRQEYHQKRQMGITEELLDIVSGFEVLRGER